MAKKSKTCPVCSTKISAEDFSRTHFMCKGCCTTFNHTDHPDAVSFSFKKLSEKQFGSDARMNKFASLIRVS